MLLYIHLGIFQNVLLHIFQKVLPLFQRRSFLLWIHLKLLHIDLFLNDSPQIHDDRGKWLILSYPQIHDSFLRRVTK